MGDRASRFSGLDSAMVAIVRSFDVYTVLLFYRVEEFVRRQRSLSRFESQYQHADIAGSDRF